MTAKGRENTRNGFFGKGYLGKLLLLLLPALVYLPAVGGKVPFPPGVESEYTDLLITHFPNLLYLKGSLVHFRQLPYWNSMIHSGTPFAANPLAGLFYLPGWIGLLFPLPGGISLGLAAHSVFGTWGMYRFLREQKLGEWASSAGAISFGLLPKLAVHYGAGHVTLLYAIFWTPWLLYFSRRNPGSWRAGIAAGMLFLADPRWTIYAGGLWILYMIAYRQTGWQRLVLSIAKTLGIAIMIAAPLLFPLLEYIPLSSRNAMLAGDIIEYRLPARQLIGLLIPASGGNIEWYFYPGGILIAFVVYQLIDPRLRKKNLFWNGVLIASLLIALSPWGELNQYIQAIPGLSLLRVPARSLFLSGFCLAYLFAVGLDDLNQILDQSVRLRKLGFGLAFFGLVFGVGLVWNIPGFSLRFIWGMIFILAAGIYFWLVGTWQASRTMNFVLLGLMVVDLLGASWQGYQLRTQGNRIQPTNLEMLQQDGEIYRIYSPSYSVGQQEAAVHGLEIADGVDPLHLAAYANYMEKAAGVSSTGYAVTIPQYPDGNPDLDNRGAVPDMELLGLLNVKYVVAEFPVEAQGLEKLAEDNGQLLYLNLNWMPRAWVEKVPGDNKPGNYSQTDNPDIFLKSPNRIRIQATGPGRLVLSEVNYPGWNAALDGEPINIAAAYGILRSIELPPGEHQVQFNFQPLSVYAGIALSGAAWLLIIFRWGRKYFAELSR